MNLSYNLIEQYSWSREGKICAGKSIGRKKCLKYFLKLNDVLLRFRKAGRVWCCGARESH